jgi:hypothetical protein
MRMRFTWLVLVGALLVLPANVRAQYYEVPPVVFTGPLSHPRYEEGGIFVSAQGLYWRQSRPLSDQQVAVRGFVDVDGSITGKTGAFVGSGTEALNVSALQGPGSWEPGLNLNLGYRFESGLVFQVGWYHLVNSTYSATASLAPRNLSAPNNLADTFLFSPVFNFPINFSGPGQKLAIGNPGATFGIWNAASLETIQFKQRFDMGEFTARIPIWQTENYRNYGLVGPRGVTMWEQFKWRTVSADVNGLSNNGTIADYRNTVSNRLYGVHLGCGNEWFLGDTPAGAFSVHLDLEAAFYYDFVKARASYELADRSTAAGRKRNLSALVPEVEARLNFCWYPWEAVQVKIGYDIFAFFNTVASPKPIDFNYGTIDPGYTSFSRLFHGLTFGIGVVF